MTRKGGCGPRSRPRSKRPPAPRKPRRRARPKRRCGTSTRRRSRVAIKNVIQALHDALWQEMERDDRVIVMGEDVGVRGGVFLATDGFYERFGADRVLDTPLAEGAIAG